MTKSHSLLISLFSSFLFWSNFCQSQESINSLGGSNIGIGGSISFSVGQLVFTTDSQSAGSLVQGIQRPVKITTTSIIKSENNISFKAYPNPATDDLYLEINESLNEKLIYKLYDLQGKVLLQNKMLLPITQINMSSFSAGTYFIQINNSQNKHYQTIQIIKKQIQ
jgi:hypothetical protein